MAEKKSRQTPDDHDLPGAAGHFEIQGAFACGRPYGSGHIHDTFLIETKGKDRPKYILQRINHAIFQDVPAVMENIVRVTAHMRGKLNAATGGGFHHDVLTVIPATDGCFFHRDEKGNYWRCYLFIEHTRTFDLVPSPELALEGGRLFGGFLKLLADLPDPPLHVTIAGFHDVEIHLQRFLNNLQADSRGRGKAVSADIAFVQARAEDMKRRQRLGQAGRIPSRVTHNDTKFNNVLFDRQGRGLCVIDLDTVMPGYAHNDFGDAIRSGCNRAHEDEPDLDQVDIDMALFQAYAKGFLSSLRGCVTSHETANLAFSAKLFAFLIGVRFLSDHLAGDRYFKIRYPGHNLQRARVQFRLLESMEARFAQMEDVISSLADSGPA